MTHYIHHHVPGRLRIRSNAFRCNNAARNKALRELQQQAGIQRVRLNPKAASVTVSYDTAATDANAIMAFLADCECMQRVPQARAVPPMKPKAFSKGSGLTGEIGRIALNVLVSKGVTYSLSSLVGARI